jgi:hypothetical protein
VIYDFYSCRRRVEPSPARGLECRGTCLRRGAGSRLWSDPSVTQWQGQVLYERGAEADARRARALPLIGQDKSRMPDHILSGQIFLQTTPSGRDFSAKNSANALRWTKLPEGAALVAPSLRG